MTTLVWRELRRHNPFVLAALAGVALVLVVVIASMVRSRGGQGATTTRYDHAEQVLTAWANAGLQRDYATAEGYMRGVDAFTLATWRDVHETNLRNGWIQQAHVIHMDQTGASITALLHFHGNNKPVCITVQVDRNDQVRPINFYHFCDNGE